ncbi:MAG: PAS domain S-box protein [Ignavibacteria bacterium]|jgi:PAS domain S-box-containing protein
MDHKTKIEEKKKDSIGRIIINTDEISGIIRDDKVLEIIEKIKSSFPFTLIGRTKIQNEIDKLSEFLWIKEISGKYIIVNESYSDWLGLKFTKVEGREEKSFLPRYLADFYNNIDSYIVDTSNSIIFEGIGGYSKEGCSTKLEIVEIPICNLDNQVIAIIGVSQKKEIETKPAKKDFDLIEKTFLEFSEPVLIVDLNNNIIQCSKSVNKIFDFPDKVSLRNKNISKLLDYNTLTKIESFINDEDFKNVLRTSFNLTDSSGMNEFEVTINKIYHKEKLSAFSVVFKTASKINKSQEIKIKMYDIIMRTSPEAIFIYDVDNLKFLEVNDSALKLYGYTRDEFLQMDLTDLYAPEDIQTLLESSGNIKVENTFSGPWRHKKRDSNSLLVMLSKTSLDFRGKKAHLNIVKDITGEIEMGKNIQLYKASFDNSSDLIFVTDNDGYITFANKSAINLLGFSKNDFDKKPFLSLLSDSDRAKINTEVFHSGDNSSKKFDVKLKKLSGDVTEVTLNSTPVTDYKGAVATFNLTIVPKVKERVVEKEIVKTVDSPSSSSKMDPKFLSHLFHELLTPINVIIGFASELTEPDNITHEEIEEAAVLIKENQHLLMQTMDTAIEYTNMENNDIQFKVDKFAFVELIEKLEENIKKDVHVKNMEIAYGKISSSLEISSDKQKLELMLTQLLKYFIAINDEAKVYISVNIQDDKHWSFCLRNKKNGITPNVQSNYSKFITAEESEVRRSFGVSRFSLRLVRKLIELMGVEFEISEKKDLPYELKFIMPLELKKTKEPETAKAEIVKPEPEVKAEKEKIREPETKEEVEKRTEEKVPEPVNDDFFTSVLPDNKPQDKENISVKEIKKVDLKTLSCLYVEDQVDSQILFKVQMKELKSIDVAASFEEAIPLLSRSHYDFIILDINLQGEYNGLDAMHIIRRMPGYEKIPIIASTAYVMPGDKDNFIAAGFSEFISKPLLKEKLTEIITSLF